MTRALRRRLDGVLATAARLLVRIFYSKVEVQGLEHVPEGHPLLVIANHGNSLVDALLLVGYLRLRPRFLAKHTLWRHPLVGPMLVLGGALPVFRRGDRGADPAHNLRIFERCARELAAGGTVAIFPEGHSHHGETLLPLKTGAARIALLAERVHGPLALRVLPVGVVYEARGRFRSRVLLRVGEPLDPSAAAGTGREREAVRALTMRMADALRGVAVRAAPWTSVTATVRSRASHFFRWIAAPLNWLPYRLAGLASDRLTRTGDEPATYKLMAGLLAFPACWTLQSVAAGLWGGIGLALAVAGASVLTAGLALLEMESAAA